MCEKLLLEHTIKAERRITYYFNLSGVYHNQKEYEKEEYYLCLFLKNHTRQLLPFMFWYIHNQRLQGKGILAVEFQIVFLHELQLLIPKTRNYKDLHLYMKQLQL